MLATAEMKLTKRDVRFMRVSQFRQFGSPIDCRGRNSINCSGPRRGLLGSNRLNEGNIFEIFPAVLDHKVGGGRQRFPMRIGETEIMQIVAAALVKIVGEYRRRLATYSRARGGLLADLQDGWPQTRVCRLIVREVVSGPAKPQWI